MRCDSAKDTGGGQLEKDTPAGAACQGGQARPEAPEDPTGRGARESRVREDDLEFAGALKALEAIVKSLESGELSLEDSLRRFEEGISLARKLESILDRAEQKIQEILNPPGDDGPAS